MEKLFEIFVSNDNYRAWMTKPFHAGKYDAATDAYALVGVEQDEGYGNVKNNGGTVAVETTVLMYLEQEANKNVVIPIEKLKEAVGFGTKQAMLVVEGECDECEGSGEVEYMYTYKGSDFYRDGECPKCEGTGVIEKDGDTPSDELIADETKCINIGVCYYHGHIVNKLLQAAVVLKQDYVTLVGQTESTKGTKFIVGNAIVILMPIHYNGDAEVYYL